MDFVVSGNDAAAALLALKLARQGQVRYTGSVPAASFSFSDFPAGLTEEVRSGSRNISCDREPGLAEAFDFQTERCRGLVVGSQEFIERRTEEFGEAGLSVEWLTGGEVRGIEPLVANFVSRGLLVNGLRKTVVRGLDRALESHSRIEFKPQPTVLSEPDTDSSREDGRVFKIIVGPPGSELSETGDFLEPEQIRRDRWLSLPCRSFDQHLSLPILGEEFLILPGLDGEISLVSLARDTAGKNQVNSGELLELIHHSFEHLPFIYEGELGQPEVKLSCRSGPGSRLLTREDGNNVWFHGYGPGGLELAQKMSERVEKLV